MADLLVRNAAELVVGPEREAMAESAGLAVHENGAVAIEDGAVVAVGPTEDVFEAHPPEHAAETIDATGKTVLPGFVDPHTHAIFAGDRSDGFVARTEGQTYTEIMDAGGGIAASVEAVREASDEQLRANLTAQLDVMLAHGTTTAEVKSGYGLDTETELRLLSAIAAVDRSHPVDLVPTFMGAHAVPEGVTTRAYVERVLDEQLPAVAEQGIAEFCDVFCEEGVFSVEDARRILLAGQEHGLAPKIHAEEFERIGGARLAAALGAVSADHLLAATADDADALREAGVVAAFLPATALALDEPYADAGPFLDGPIALATDCNPSCFVHSMATVTSLACMGMGLQPSRAIRASTHGSARALGAGNGAGGDDKDSGESGSGSRLPSAGTGTLREGTAADLAVFDLPSHVHIPYNGGTNRVDCVVKDGTIVVDSSGHAVRNNGREKP